MIKKYGSQLSLLYALVLVMGMLFGNFQTGKAQSETGWTTPVNLSLSGVAATPLMVIDSEGIIHVIWLDEVDGYKYSQSVDGVKWSTPLSVAYPFQPDDIPPTLLADARGLVHIVWVDKLGILYYSRTPSSDFGNPGSWGKTILSENVSSFDVELDALGEVHIAYIQNVTDSTTQAGVYYRHAVAGGTWSRPQQLYTSEYFRMTTALDAYVRVAATGQGAKQKIYVSWDNRPQKRIYIASSDNAGKTWSAAQQFKGPDDSGKYNTPFNSSVWAGGENVLFMWQVGAPGASKCSVFSQWSEDGGKTWGEALTLFGGATTCPSGIKYVTPQQEDKVVVALATTGNPILLAWNGAQWSEVQSQASLPALSNPLTYDAILLGCRQDVIFKDKLFVVGCDQANGGDVWFLSRSLTPVDDWFAPLSIWGNSIVQKIDEQAVSFLSSATDSEGNINIVWVETPLSNDGSKPSILYSRWNGIEWSGPETIIRNLDGEPKQLTIYIDSLNRVLLAWVDGTSGDLLFSWANLEQASKLSGWVPSKVLPSPSQLNSSPDIAVDAAGRIIVVYAVPLNENRGVYLVQSTDNGLSWSPYVQIFDGVASKWDKVDAPKITISGEGGLHVLFTRQSIRNDQLVGMYYSQSQDGGVSWNVPQVISEGSVSWSDIVSYGEQTIHMLWQEDNGLVVANLSQVSQDGGASWGKVLDVTDVGEMASPVTLATNGDGQLSFIQLNVEKPASGAGDDTLKLYDWKWDGISWNPETSREISLKGNGNYSVIAGITTKDYLGVSLSASYHDVTGTFQDQVISFGRFRERVGDQGSGTVVPAPVVSTPALPVETAVAPPLVSPVPTIDNAILFESNDPSEGISKNLVGLGLIGVTVIAGFLLLIRRRSSAQK